MSHETLDKTEGVIHILYWWLGIDILTVFCAAGIFCGSLKELE
jgi:hypothetical protein